MGRRIRTPQPKPDTLIAVWGRCDRHAPASIVYVYPDRDGKVDSRVLCDAIESRQYSPDPERYGAFKLSPSLTEELDARGWDLTTLRISIKRKARPTTGDSDDRT